METTKKSSIAIALSMLLLVSVSISCSDEHDFIEEPTVEGKSDSVRLKGAYNNGYFNFWEVKELKARLGNNTYYTLSVPWVYGSTKNSFISSEWLDPNLDDPDLAKRLYSKQNGWELVYSNMNEPSEKKFFALYNKHTGRLRFFLHAIATGGAGLGSTGVFWGIKTEKANGMFNFVSPVAEPVSTRKPTPAYVTSNIGEFYNGIFANKGYQEGQWYGFEIEVAYDPQLQANTDFKVVGWATTNMIIKGNIQTIGEVKGTITSTTPASSGMTFNVSNMFNRTTTNNTDFSNTLNVTGTDAVEHVANKVQDGVDKKDKFMTSLWENLKSNAGQWITSGLKEAVKDGVKAIATSGFSEVTKLASSLFSSLLGTSNQSTTSTIDLKISMNSKLEAEGTTQTVGFGGISVFPVPSSSTNPYNIPYYNKPLGVWNLKAVPQLEYILLGMYNSQNKPTWGATYKVIGSNNADQIALNPEIAKDFRIENFKIDLLVQEGTESKFPMLRGQDYFAMEAEGLLKPYGEIGGKRYFITRNSHLDLGNSRVLTWDQPYFPQLPTKGHISEMIVKVSFDLTHKTDGKKQYMYKYFHPSLTQAENRIMGSPGGAGPGGGLGGGGLSPF